jgi:hypothetical protein
VTVVGVVSINIMISTSIFYERNGTHQGGLEYYRRPVSTTEWVRDKKKTTVSTKKTVYDRLLKKKRATVLKLSSNESRRRRQSIVAPPHLDGKFGSSSPPSFSNVPKKCSPAAIDWDRVRFDLEVWRRLMYRSQPLVEISDVVIRATVGIVRILATCESYAKCFLDSDVLFAYVAAAFLVCRKILGCKSSLPSPSLVSSATGIPVRVLVEYEIAVCKACDWDFSRIFRRNGWM